MNRAKVQWTKNSDRLLEEILEKIVLVANMPLNASEKANFGYHHALFLKEKIKSLENSWYFEYFCFGIEPEVVVYLSQHISQE